MADPRKLCLFCKSFYLEGATPGYSEYTPGTDFHMSCDKRHWTFDPFDYMMDSERFRALLAKARECKDYVRYNE